MGGAGEILVQQTPSSGATSRVKPDTIQRAVKALLKWKNSQSKSQKPQLLGEDDFMYLVLTMRKIPPKDRTNAYKIPLPHSLRDSSSASEFCLLIDDRDRSKAKLTSEDAKKKIKAEGIPISKVVKLSKLKTDYRPFEAKRKLCDSYDMFFADRRVIPLLPKLLGKQFFKKKKIPVPVDLTHKNWKEQIERACSSALLYMRTGTCSVLKVGKSSLENEQIVENVLAAIDGVAEIVPKKWNGVRSFHLKFSESLALPIYQVMPEMLLKIEGVKRVEEEASIKEVSGVEVNVDDKNEKLVGQKDSDKKKSKGRIHDVQYMDEDEIGSDADDEATEDLKKNDDEEMEEEKEEEEEAASAKKKRKQKDLQIPSKLKSGEKTKRFSSVEIVDEESVGKDSAKKAKKMSLNVGEESVGKDSAKKAKKKSFIVDEESVGKDSAQKAKKSLNVDEEYVGKDSAKKGKKRSLNVDEESVGKDSAKKSNKKSLNVGEDSVGKDSAKKANKKSLNVGEESAGKDSAKKAKKKNLNVDEESVGKDSAKKANKKSLKVGEESVGKDSANKAMKKSPNVGGKSVGKDSAKKAMKKSPNVKDKKMKKKLSA